MVLNKKSKLQEVNSADALCHLPVFKDKSVRVFTAVESPASFAKVCPPDNVHRYCQPPVELLPSSQGPSTLDYW